MTMSFSRGYVPEGGLELNAIMPSINPFDPAANREGRFQRILERIKSFFAKFFSVADGKFAE